METTLPLLVVDEVTKAGGVDNVELQADTVFFNVSAQYLDVDSLRALLGKRGVLFSRVQGGVEESVDQSRFAQSRFTYEHECNQNGGVRYRERLVGWRRARGLGDHLG